MAIRELGEFGLIDVIQENTIFSPESVVVGIGDDDRLQRCLDHALGQFQVLARLRQRAIALLQRVAQILQIQILHPRHHVAETQQTDDLTLVVAHRQVAHSVVEKKVACPDEGVARAYRQQR